MVCGWYCGGGVCTCCCLLPAACVCDYIRNIKLHVGHLLRAVMGEFMELLDSPTFKSYGSSLKLVMVAEGQAHIYPRQV